MVTGIAAWLIAIPPALALLVFSLEIAFGLRPLPSTKEPSADIRIAVLVPAHNEELSISGTIKTLTTCASHVRVLVVADNCSDNTAAIALAEGAECISRNDGTKRGKGYALAYGRDFLALDPPDVVVVLDADCRMDAMSLQRIAAAAHGLNAPVQARNLVVAPDGAPSLVQISNFAMLIKNLVRARGLYRIAGGIPLFGTGMAFPWTIFRSADLATADMVEDLKLAVRLACQGISVHLIDQALVLSGSAAADDTIGQRRRWEHGFLRTASREAFPLLARGLRHYSRHQVMLALHLCVPPLALLLALSVASSVVSLSLGLISGNFAPAIVLVGCLTLCLGLTLLAWWTAGRSALTPRALLDAPGYVFRKLPMYLSLIKSSQTSWNRTRRDGEHD